MDGDYNFWLNRVSMDFPVGQFLEVPPALREDPVFLRSAINENYSVLRYLSKDTPNYEELCKIVLSRAGCYLRYVSPDTPNYKELCMIAFKQDPLAIRFMPQELLTPALYKVAVERDHMVIGSIPETCEDYNELCAIAVGRNPSTLRFMSPKGRQHAIRYIASRVLAKVFSQTTLMQEAYAVNSKTTNSKGNPDKKVALKNVFRRPEIIEELFTDFIASEGIGSESQGIASVIKDRILKYLEIYYKNFLDTNNDRKNEVIEEIDSFFREANYLEEVKKYLEIDIERKEKTAHAIKEQKEEEKKLITNLATKKTAESSGVFRY